MTWYQAGLAVHALVAVLGIGQVLAIAILASGLKAGSQELPTTAATISGLSRITSISLGLMLLSGIGLMIPTNGAYAAQWWFRISFVLFFVLGFFNGQVGRALRTVGGSPSDAVAAAISRLRSASRVMVVLVAIIVMLMAAKPF